jgi:hypothetical protein
VVDFSVVELAPPVKHVVIDDDAHGEVEDAPVPLQVVHAEEGVRTRSKSKLKTEKMEKGEKKKGIENKKKQNLLKKQKQIILMKMMLCMQKILMMMRIRLRR